MNLFVDSIGSIIIGLLYANRISYYMYNLNAETLINIFILINVVDFSS